MTDYEIYSYEVFRSHVHDDERIINRADISLLDQDSVGYYISQMKKERPGFSKLTDEQVYEMLAITRKVIPTLAAILKLWAVSARIFSPVSNYSCDCPERNRRHQRSK